jgi:hypothetical protein
MYNLPPQERLVEWKNFRSSLDTMSFDDAVYSVNDFWNKQPIGNQFFSQDNPISWPDPWEILLDNNSIDDISKALGIAYSLHLSKHGKEHSINIICFHNRNKSKQTNTVQIDENKYVLNMDTSVSVNISLEQENLGTIVVKVPVTDLI